MAEVSIGSRDVKTMVLPRKCRDARVFEIRALGSARTNRLLSKGDGHPGVPVRCYRVASVLCCTVNLVSDVIVTCLYYESNRVAQLYGYVVVRDENDKR